jgi:multicomponent K+:H+ antiporter subunit A
MGSMLGIVASDSLILLFVFWEATTITSALLIGMDFGNSESRRGAITAFLVTGAGGLALLAGIVVLGQIAGTYDLSTLAERSEMILADPRSSVALILLLLGAFTKSAQFPFHFWLPGAMAAPAPVSAYLHSATMVKAGVFLLGRLFPIFSASPLWLPILATVGLTTFLVAGWNAVRAYDLKQLLAHSTVAYLGVLTALYGFYARVGLQGELVNILNHALYKSSLFLLIGWVEKAMGTRDLAVLQRERWIRREPIGAALIGRRLRHGRAALPARLHGEGDVLHGGGGRQGRGSDARARPRRGGELAGDDLRAEALRRHLLGTEEPPEGRGYPRHKISRWLLIVPAVLLVPQVVGGVIPGWYLGAVIEPGTRWPEGSAFWKHLDVKLALSIGIIIAGVAGFRYWRRLAAVRIHRARNEPPTGSPAVRSPTPPGSATAFRAAAIPRFLSIMLLATVAAMVGGLYWGGGSLPTLPSLGPDVGIAWIPALLVSVAAILTAVVPDRIPKIVMMAVVGIRHGGLLRDVPRPRPRADAAAGGDGLVTPPPARLPGIPKPAPGRLKGHRWAHLGVAVVTGTAMGALAWLAGAFNALDRAGHEQLAMSFRRPRARTWST